MLPGICFQFGYLTVFSSQADNDTIPAQLQALCLAATQSASAIEDALNTWYLLIKFDGFMTVLDKHTSDIQKLCAQHKVKKLYAFGSALTPKFNSDSDIDFIVDFQALDIDHYADNYFNLKFALEEVFERRIDLLEEKTIRNPYFKQAIDNQRRLVYEA